MAPQPVFQLRIQLEHVRPAVWRRLLVPGGVRLAKLHDIFQAAMGWTNSHLHSFTIGEDLYGMHVEDYPDETEFTVFVALRGGVRRFRYEYDFGDSWEHEWPTRSARSMTATSSGWATSSTPRPSNSQ